MTIILATLLAQHSFHFAEDNHDGEDNHDHNDHYEGPGNADENDDHSDYYKGHGGKPAAQLLLGWWH